MKTITFLNEKGNAMPSIRAGILEQVAKKLENCLSTDTDLATFERDGKMFKIPLATDRKSGQTIYLKMDCAISTHGGKKEEKKAITPVTIKIFD